MRVSFITGWILLLGAFAVAAAETVARALPGGAGWMLSAHELWQAYGRDRICWPKCG